MPTPVVFGAAALITIAAIVAAAYAFSTLPKPPEATMTNHWTANVKVQQADGTTVTVPVQWTNTKQGDKYIALEAYPDPTSSVTGKFSWTATLTQDGRLSGDIQNINGQTSTNPYAKPLKVTQQIIDAVSNGLAPKILSVENPGTPAQNQQGNVPGTPAGPGTPQDNTPISVCPTGNCP